MHPIKKNRVAKSETPPRFLFFFFRKKAAVFRRSHFRDRIVCSRAATRAERADCSPKKADTKQANSKSRRIHEETEPLRARLTEH